MSADSPKGGDRCAKPGCGLVFRQHHTSIERDGHVFDPACRCGSGAHPRRCEVHPARYAEHCAELSAEADSPKGDDAVRAIGRKYMTVPMPVGDRFEAIAVEAFNAGRRTADRERRRIRRAQKVAMAALWQVRLFQDEDASLKLELIWNELDAAHQQERDALAAEVAKLRDTIRATIETARQGEAIRAKRLDEAMGLIGEANPGYPHQHEGRDNGDLDRVRARCWWCRARAFLATAPTASAPRPYVPPNPGFCKMVDGKEVECDGYGNEPTPSAPVAAPDNGHAFVDCQGCSDSEECPYCNVCGLLASDHATTKRENET